MLVIMDSSSDSNSISSSNDGSNDGSDVSIGESLDEAIKLEVPRKFAVLLHNDDYTTMEFVIDVLHAFFKKSHDEAMKIMLLVHHEGKGVAGIYSSEIAETKVAQVTAYAVKHQQPLKVTAEPAEES